MKKNILKKLFIKISKIFDYEIIHQAEFISPTLDKKLNDELSIINEKSIILPLGQVKITKKVRSILIIFRMNTDVEIWDQNRRRLFELPKIEYTKRSINSLIKSIQNCKKKYSNINIKTIIVDDNSNEKNLSQIKRIIEDKNIDIESLDYSKYQNIIKKQKNQQTFANLASLLQSFEIGKEKGEDLIFFVEDDYLHFESALEEMISTYERVSSQTNKDLFICPSDYPFFYMNNEKTSLLIGSKRHWRTINKTLCSFLTSHKFIDKYWDNFYNNCLDRHDPFEKYLNELYFKEICISPIKSLSVHFANINSSYGLSPYIDYKSLWDENNFN